ncbi:unnamed protein product [Rotaria magnacalcarata]|uniref:Kinesin light chain n=1 Tax=Rotaria magnacalcarata TaxID=392030 RepID=A0A816DRP2_9BILA|nr:unnamed protein product [Rotaria magnacalcarata]CAF1640584.1 unnamed protein product [Rotaria magnacalcarata]CAF2080112.1 unnamed protein product [Rotaria magnacalcarata]CAF3860206.1 unnamed protein product [Rotaria magnacalcarata]CAF3867754.1 unnamed protein product [Rotaria magnacalcarata]
MTASLLTHDLTHTSRSVISSLETLKQEHNLLLSTSNNEDKRASIKQSLESIDLGMGEAVVMLQLEHHLDDLDSETYKLMLQVRRLTEENNWLRDELSMTEKTLQTSTQTKQEYEKDILVLNESLASIVANEDLHLTSSIDIDKDVPPEIKEQTPVVPNLITDVKNYSEVPARFRTLHNLVIQYAQAGRYEVAVPLCRQALEDLEKSHGHTHPDVATMLNILALVYRDQNKFKEALQLLTEALTIREKTLGFEHPAVAATLNNLAVLYGKKNRYKEAEPLCKRALEIREKCFGVDHPDVGKQLNNLALLCLNQGKYDKVEEYYKRAIDIYIKHYGNNDPNVAKTKNNLASAYLREGKYKLAAQLYQEVLSNEQYQNSTNNVSTTPISIRDGSTVMTTLKNLGALCRRQGFYEQADYIESCATKATEDPGAIDRALYLLRQLRIYDDNNQGTIRRTQQQPPPQEYGRLRRSGSFQKLRQSIRRGSEKLVQKLRGTSSSGWNNQSINSSQYEPQPQQQYHQQQRQQDDANYGPMKRASSMSVLNNVPLQQQPMNRPLGATNSVEQQNNSSFKQQYSSKFSGRLTSAENLH